MSSLMVSDLTPLKMIDFALTHISHRPQPEYVYTGLAFRGFNGQCFSMHASCHRYILCTTRVNIAVLQRGPDQRCRAQDQAQK